jgi:hypothetical protein
MESLPNELIGAIATYFDIASLVRFSRTCWQVYSVARVQIDQLMIPRRHVLDEIRAIKYDVYPRKISSDDGFGPYCGIREIRGRLVGSVSCTTYLHSISTTVIRDDVVMFSNGIHMNKLNYDNDRIIDIDADIFCRLHNLSDEQFQIDVIHTVRFIDVKITREQICRAVRNDMDDIFAIDESGEVIGQYSDFGIYAKSPTIVNGDLQWKY